MSNDSGDTPAGSGFAPLLLAAAALAIYFLLISQWHATPAVDRTDQPSEARESAPQLELSRRLSTPTGAAETAAPANMRSWLWPVAAFVPPLLIGMLWGSARVRGTDRELVFASTHVRTPEPDTADRAGEQPERMLATSPANRDAGNADRGTAPAFDDRIATAVAGSDPDAGAAATTDEEAGDRETLSAADEPADTPDSVEPAESFSDAHVAVAGPAGEPVDNDADGLPDDIEALRAAVRARDEVIRSLEDIVRENRESWAEQEGSADSQAHQIKALQAELDAANDVIELLQLADSDHSRDNTPRPQVLERS